MKKRNYFNVLNRISFILLICLATSCSDDNIPSYWDEETKEYMLNLGNAQSEETLPITATGSWTIETEGGWFCVYPETGTGNAEVTIFIESNPETEEKRDGVLRVVFDNKGQKEQVLNLLQHVNSDGGVITDNGILGYGYDIFGYYANPSSVRGAEIFSESKIKAAQLKTSDKLTSEVSLKKASESSRTGTSVTEFSRKFKIDAGISGSYLGFSGEVKSSFGENYQENGEDEYAQFSYKYIEKRINLTLAVIDGYEEFLSDAAYKAINGTKNLYQGEKGIKRLIDNYGTHVVVSGYLGGRVDYSMLIHRSQISDDYEINAYLKASYSGFFSVSAEVDTKYSESYKKNQSHCEISINAVGGNIRVSKKEDLDQWHKNVVDGAWVLMDFDENSLIPIWELCEDETRANTIKEYVLNNHYIEQVGDIFKAETKKIDIPDFSETKTGSLVKTVTIDGVPVAEICNEYIPGISRNSRVTVIYPIVDGKTVLSAGLFVGSNKLPPIQVSWSNTVFPEVTSSSEPIGQVNTVYLKGKKITTSIPMGSSNVIDCDVSDYYMTGYKGENLYDYPVVKVGKYFWLREDYTANKDFKGGHEPTHLGSYYTEGSSHTWPGSMPEGWEVPSVQHGKDLIVYVENNSGRLRTVSSITGMNFLKDCWYILTGWEDYPYGFVNWTYTKKTGLFSYWLQDRKWLNVYTNGTSMDVGNPPNVGKPTYNNGFDLWPYAGGLLRYVRK